MVQQFRWFGRRQPEIDRNGMALPSPDALPVRGKREPLLVIRADHFFQEFPRNRPAVLVARPEQFVDRDPTLGIERDAHGLRSVPQHEAKELAG